MENQSELYALDIETTGLDSFADTVLCIGVYGRTGAYCFRTVAEFANWHRPTNQYIAHNGSFDFNFLSRAGLDVSNAWTYDTRSLASIMVPAPIEPNTEQRNLSLEFLTKHYLNLGAYKLDRTRMQDYSFEELKAYNLEDCKRTYELFEYLVSHLDTKDWEFYINFLMPATKLAALLEYNGIYIDQPGLKAQMELISKEREEKLIELNKAAAAGLRAYKAKQIAELKTKYNDMAKAQLAKPNRDPSKVEARYAGLLEKAISRVEEFNWSSPTQLRWLLKDFYALDIVNSRTGEESTDEATLSAIDHPICKAILAYRELDKLYTASIPALLDNIKADNCVHGRYNVGGTRTGRLSSSGPNLQQVSGRLHKYIVASPGKLLVTADFGQIEPRLLAHASGEPSLLEAFNNNHDIYSMFARLIFNLDVDLKGFKEKYPTERNVGKTGGLSVIYGTGPRKFAEMVLKGAKTVIPLNKSKQLVENFRKSMPKVAELKDKLELKAMNQKKIYNLMGRPFYIETNDDLYMLTLNTFIQGSASDLVAHVFNKLIHKWSFIKPRMIVHDEVVFEIPLDRESFVRDNLSREMTDEIQQEFNLSVPLKIEFTIGREWAKP